jgi:transcriptional regulator with XRE-family HTH domain
MTNQHIISREVRKMKEKFMYIRNKLGLSQKQIAGYLDVDQSYVSKIENGERGLTVDLAEKMCNLIGYDISFFANNNVQDALNISFRGNTLDPEDLKAIARINEIVMKLREMREISKVIEND